MPDELRAEYEAAVVAAKAALAERKARAEEEAKAREAREAEEASRRAAAVNDWVALHGSDLHKARRKRGLMPDSEVLDLVREQVFGPFSEFPRYERIDARSVISEAEAASEGDYFDGDPDLVSFKTVPANSLADPQLIQLCSIESCVPLARVEVRAHLGRYDGTTMITRKAALVTIDWHGHKLSREYALREPGRPAAAADDNSLDSAAPPAGSR